MATPIESFLGASGAAQNIVQRRDAFPLEQKQRQQVVQQREQQLDAGSRQKALQGAQVMSQFLQRVKEIPDPQQRLQLFQQARPELEQFGINLPPPERLTLESVTDEGLVPLESGIGRTLQELTAGQREFQSLTQGLPQEDVEQARRVKLGIAPRAGMSAQERIATDQGLGQAVTSQKAQEAEATERAKGAGATASKVVEQGFEKIQKIDANLRNIDRAIGALDRGGKTGAFQKFLPSITEASRDLRQVQRELGLDIIGSVTFGALSEGELALALETALDLGQSEEALKRQLLEKKEAQRKLSDYLEEQINFLEDGGTVGEFLAFKRGKSGGQSGAQVLRFDAQGNLIQ